MKPVPLLLAALVLAGCASTTNAPTPPTSGGSDRVLYAPDCSIGNADGNWTEACVAKASPNPSPSKAEIDIAANPKDPNDVIVASKDLDRSASSCVWAVPQVSHDGGKTWKTVYVGGKKADRKPGDPLYGWDCITDPILTFTKDGVAHYSLQIYNFMTGGAAVPVPGVGNVGSEIAMVSSKDGGDSWGGFLTLHAGDGNAVFHDYMRTAANPKTGTVYTIWNQISSAGPAGGAVPVMVAVRSGASAAQPPVYIPVPDAPGNVGETSIFAGSDGTVYVMLTGGGDDASASAYLATSTDDGVTFSVPQKAFSVKPIASPLPNSKFRVGTYVEAAIDKSDGPHKDCLYAAWVDGAKGAGDADIMSTHSCDHGKTWAPPARVNHDATASDQVMTRVAVGADGTVHVAYLTRAYSANNTLLDAEYAYSTDGGASWATKRLTTKSFDGDLGIHQDGFPFFGDYIGIDSQGPRTYVGFPDSGTGVSEIGVAAIAREPTLTG